RFARWFAPVGQANVGRPGRAVCLRKTVRKGRPTWEDAMNDTACPTIGAEMEARIREAIQKDPGRMTMHVARELGVPEAEVSRLMPSSTPLDVSRWEELVRALEPLGTVHVIVSNGATTLEAVGQFGGFSTWGPFFNVQTDSLDMHIRWQELASAFA